MIQSEEEIEKAINDLLTWCKNRKQEIRNNKPRTVDPKAGELLKFINPENYRLTQQKLIGKKPDQKINEYNQLLMAEALHALQHLAKPDNDGINSLKQLYLIRNGVKLIPPKSKLIILTPKEEKLQLRESQYKIFRNYQLKKGIKPEEIVPIDKWQLNTRRDCPAFPQRYPNPFTNWWLLDSSDYRSAIGAKLGHEYNKYRMLANKVKEQITWNSLLNEVLTSWIKKDHEHTKFVIKMVISHSLELIEYSEKTEAMVDDPEYYGLDVFGYMLTDQEVEELMKEEEDCWDFPGFMAMFDLVKSSLVSRPINNHFQDKVIEVIDIVISVVRNRIQFANPYEALRDEEIASIPESLNALITDLIAMDNRRHHKGRIPSHYKDNRGFIGTMVPTEFFVE